MAGNVWAWCWDRYDDYPGTVTDPVDPASGSYRVLRGGLWSSDASAARAASRNNGAPDNRSSGIGFRLAWSRP
ncbi:MAG: SUMF1/EgtB/PvdO family nonheme iron enzyme [Candidatus Sericytochromatia bacterium]|nr:SUMF1/EgtB/PvdO family nonheme iron enzyme [Candidatus Tanganyikabacteria bacterium]